jgi:hypothetical protein
MLIDAMDIKHSGRATSTVVVGPSQERFIVDWTNLLLSAGWTLVEGLHAQGTLTYPLGFPITDGVTVLPKTVIGCSAPPGILTIAGQQYSFYDPFKQIPGSTTACIFVEEGLDNAGSLANLVAAVNLSGVWFAVGTHISGVNYRIDFTATITGPLLNEETLSGNAVTGSTQTWGGGYRLQSSSSSNSAVYRCATYAANRNGAGDDYLNGDIVFEFTINGDTIVYQLLNDVQGTLGDMGALGVGPVPQYTIVANPFGFCVFDLPHNPTSHIFRLISLFAMAPYFPVAGEVPAGEVFVPAYAVFVLGPNTVGGSPAWNFQGPSTMSLDAPPFQRVDKNPAARALGYQSLSLPLLTVYGVPMFYGPYVQFGSGSTNTDPAWVVGKLWDCAIVTDYVATGAGLDGKDFLAIGGSDGSGPQVVGTFLMDAGTTGVYAALGQSARCASAPGNPGTVAYFNTAR